MVGFMKGLGCGCCSQGGGHCVGTTCSTHYPNYFCPATFLPDEFPRVCEFASQSEVCGPWGYRKHPSPLSQCRTDPPIAYGTYFETQSADGQSGGIGTVGAQWRSSKNSTFTFTKRSYLIISPWEFDFDTNATSFWSPRSLINNLQCKTMQTAFGGGIGVGGGGGSGGTILHHLAGPIENRIELDKTSSGGLPYYRTKLSPHGGVPVSFLITNPLYNYVAIDPQPFQKSFIDMYVDSTIILRWENGNELNVETSMAYEGRYYYARHVPPNLVEWNKINPEAFSGSVSGSTTINLNCGDAYYAGYGLIRHPCYTHGIWLETASRAVDRVNGLIPAGWLTLQPEPLEAAVIRVLRMEATKS